MSTMEHMSEQLWYTWSQWGFGGGDGFQIRAVSPGLRDTRGSVNIYSKPILVLMKHLNYALPQDVVNNYDVVPENTPRCLAFMRIDPKDAEPKDTKPKDTKSKDPKPEEEIKPEAILIHKRYTGLDGVKRPGAFFSHLLKKLPVVESPRPEGTIEFSAREAISLWGSDFWKASDTLERGDTKLPQVVLDVQYHQPPREKMLESVRNGPLTETAIGSTDPQHLLLVIQAFLMLEKGQRLFIAADPDTVAILIWALTHCLPRTLTVMHDLTFSTYERIDEEKNPSISMRQTEHTALPIIVGTSWLYGPRDLPASYYQENNPRGFALNCYLPNRWTPFTPTDYVARFAQFAVDCFLGRHGHSVAELDELWKKAERDNKTDIADFLRLYITYQAKLAREEIMEMLHDLINKIASRQRGERVQVNPEALQRENVQSSILHWATLDPPWWETQCSVALEKLRKFVDASSPIQFVDALSQALHSLAERAVKRLQEALRSNVEPQTKLWTNVITISVPLRSEVQLWISLFQAFSIRELDTPAYRVWWNDTGRDSFMILSKQVWQRTDNALATPLSPFGELVAAKVRDALQGHDQHTLSYWQEMLATVATPSTEPMVWAHFLQETTLIGQFQLYQLWWQKRGKVAVSEYYALTNKLSVEQLTLALLAFAQKTAERLVEAISNNHDQPASLWGEMLFAAAPLSKAGSTSQINHLAIWNNLQSELLPSLLQPAYQSWWRKYGRLAATNLRLFANSHPQSDIAQTFNLSAQYIADWLLKGLQANNGPILTFLGDVLLTMAPYKDLPYRWYHLLQCLCQDPYMPAYQQWWNFQGKDAARTLRILVDTAVRLGQPDLDLDLSLPASEAAKQLIGIIQDSTTPQTRVLEHEKDVLPFWQEVLITIAPWPDNLSTQPVGDGVPKIWMDLITNLWSHIYTPAFSLWWQQQGQKTTGRLREFVDSFPRSDIAQPLENFVYNGLLREINATIDKIVNTVEPMTTYIARCSILLDILVTSTPKVMLNAVWANPQKNLLQRLSSTISPENFSWELRQTLLRTWASLPDLVNHEYIAPWLAIEWDDIAKFKSLRLPPAWYTTAFTRLLSKTDELPPSQLSSLISADSPFFEGILQQCMAKPETAARAVDCFAIIAKQSYTHKVPLLGTLLLAGRHLPELVIQTLLTKAILSPEESAELLEVHCQQILAEHKLPLALQGFVTDYLRSFDIERLGQSSTTTFLNSLQKRVTSKKPDLSLPDELIAYIRGWSTLNQLIAQPALRGKWLQKVSYQVRTMSKLQPGTRAALSHKLVPIFIEQISGEADLVRVLDNLGAILTGDDLDPGLALLRSMAPSIREKYGREHPPVRLVPYIHIFLEQANTLDDAKKVEFIDPFLDSLLMYAEEAALARISLHTELWPQDIATAWQEYLERYYTALMNKEREEREKSEHNTQTALVTTSSPSTTEKPVATVNGIPITPELLDMVQILKHPYIEYRIDYLHKDIQAYPEHQWFRNPEIQTLEKIKRQPSKLPLFALDDLINDILIQEQIDVLIHEGQAKEQDFTLAMPTLEGFKNQYGRARYEEDLLQKHHLTEQDVIEVLQIFRRSELFALHLSHTEEWKGIDLPLQAWLKKRRSLEKQQITIDYDQIGLPRLKRLRLHLWPF